MKRIITEGLVFFFILFCLFVPFGCQWLGDQGIAAVRARAEKQRYELANTIIDCIKEKNTEKLIHLLCAKTQNISDIREQIEEGFAFFEGNIRSYAVQTDVSMEGAATDDGIITEYEAGQDIYDIVTDSGNEYELYFHMFYIIPDAEREGVTFITMQSGTGETERTHQIGYGWNSSYYYEVSCLAQTVIEAIDDRDMIAMKNAFCAETLAKNGIEGRIREVFEFFEGKATLGMVTDRFGERYDGNHDFYLSTLTDNTVIENYEPKSIYIEAYTENIETDTDKTYSMEWAAYLLHENKKSEGVVRLTLIEGANRCTVE